MFVALDVETANRNGGSICQIGIVAFENGAIVDEWQTLVNPRARFDAGNVRVHGIRPADVADAPTFRQIAGEIHERTTGQIVVAHNASFDRSCLRYAHKDARLAEPDARWLCTVRVARRAWADELDRFGLKVVASHLGLRFQHHDALEDARACGQVLQAACELTGLDPEAWLTRVGRPVREGSRVPRTGPPARGIAGGGRRRGSISERALASRFGSVR